MRRAAWLSIVVVAALSTRAAAQPTALDAYAAFATTQIKAAHGTSLGSGAIGSNGRVLSGRDAVIQGPIAADYIGLGAGSDVLGSIHFNRGSTAAAVVHGHRHSPLAQPLPTLPAPAPVNPAPIGHVIIGSGDTYTIAPGPYRRIDIGRDAVVTIGGPIDVDIFIARGGTTEIRCAVAICPIGVRSQLKARARFGSTGGGDFAIRFGGSGSVPLGAPGATVRASVQAPFAHLKLQSSARRPSNFVGRYRANRITIGGRASVQGEVTGPICGDGLLGAGEQCDPPAEASCPGACEVSCECPPLLPQLELHSVGPSLLQNATDFGLQIFGANFEPGAELEIYDQLTSGHLLTLPTTFVSAGELTALMPAGLAVPSGIQRELRARIRNPDGTLSGLPSIGHCATDLPVSPIACTKDSDCPFGAGPCVTGDQRLTMFNDLVFLNPSSAVVIPAPYGVCDDGAPCAGAADCSGIGSGACSAKLYVTPQQVDELWLYNTGTGEFVDIDAGSAGIQGIPVGDNPFHVELLVAGGAPRAWVVNRFDDGLSIIDPSTDSEIARITGTGLGAPGRLRMGTEVEFNRAGTRAYVSNQNLDEVLVLDITGARRDAPVLIGSIDVGVNPRGMATNTADTRLYVANVQSADVSVVDTEQGSPTEHQVLDTIGARPTDDIIGGRADGWEPFVIGARAPRGIVFSDDLQTLFVTSIGPQTGPRAGVNQVGGAIINPTITVIDAASHAVVAHVALNGRDPDRFKCTDPELMALDDVRGRLYVTCQGSGTIDILDTAALVAAAPAELHVLELPLPSDAVVPTMALNSVVGAFGAKVCAAFTTSPGTACLSDTDCTGCPPLREGLPVECCATNSPVGLHNGPRGLAISEDRDTLYVVNQFTTSIATVDVSATDPTLAAVTHTRSFPGAFGSNTEQRDRRLGQIQFFTDVKGTNTSCATCHIDDHQDGVFFEADVAGPRLRRVLSVRGTRDFPPLLQDQLVPDLVAFTDIVVHVERGGGICTPCTELAGAFTCFPAPAGTCNMTSNSENQQNTFYAKAITFFPNPNLNPDGSLSTDVPLPGGVSGNAVAGAVLFDQLNCANCHPAPMFTIDQFRVFFPIGFSLQPLRMREVQTPVHLPLRSRCQDANRPAGVDGSAGFGVPTLRGIWDTFPLLMSGAAGLKVVGSEPSFTNPCTSGSSGCCTQLQSPLNPSGTAVPPQYLEVDSKDALRALLTPPLAVSGTGHGSALGLTPTELNNLMAYLRSL